jgi:ribonuclease HIII
MLDEEFDKIKRRLIVCGFLLSEIKKIQYGLQFKAIFGEEEGIIRIYENKKYGIKIDTSLMKGTNLINKFNACLERKKLNFNPSLFQNLDDTFDFYIGSDESGKGDYFGPLVVAGVMVSNENLNYLENLGIKDSKLLKEDKVFYLESEIINSKIPYKRITLLPERYNKIYTDCLLKNTNLNDILAKAHCEVDRSFLNANDKFKIVVDKFSINSGMDNMFANFKNVKFLEIERSESKFLYVAAASILARAKFLREMKRLSKEIGFTLKRGSVNVGPLAQQIADTYGFEGLKRVAKLHFKITKGIKFEKC